MTRSGARHRGTLRAVRLAVAGVALAAATIACPVLAAGAAPAAPAPASCDRNCLLELADGYLAALVAHDPKKVALAPDLKFVENVKRVQLGEGLWKTASGGPTAFKIVIPDAYSQQVAVMVMMQSDGKPAQVGMRLKVVNGRIAEAEHLVVMTRNGATPASLEKVRAAIPMEVPYEYRDSRGRLVHIAKSYYDALDDNNGSLAPFGDDCERHENGFTTAPFGGPNSPPPPGGGAARAPGLTGMQTCARQLDSGTFQYIGRIENRRVEVADEVTGLAMGLSHFRHPMTTKVFTILNNPDRDKSDMSNQRAFDMPAMHIYKIWGGQIHEIEAIGVSAEYNAPTGWE